MGLDFIWLGVFAKGFYQSEVGSLLLERPNLYVALIFYIFYVAGVQIFTIWPAMPIGSFARAISLGAAFGLIAYGTYDLSNLSTLKGWTTKLAIVDIGWGVLLTSITTACGYFLAKSLRG